MVTVSRARVRFLFALFAIASLVLSARVAYWQTVGRGDLLARATDQVRSDLVVAAQRGVIRDRAGAILATTVELRSLYAIPGQMKDRDGRDDDALRGTAGRLVVERDPANRELAIGLRTASPARAGQDLVLTLDLAVQTAAERELAAAVQREKAAGGSIVILDPRDGAVLALASSPTYDPARVGSAAPEALRDRAIAWTYEPGSTMKAITVAAAIDK